MSLKTKLSKNILTLGSWVTLGHSSVAEIMAKTGGFDWLAIDMEHSVIEMRDCQELIQAIDLCGVAPLVRVMSNNHDNIRKVMDVGAQGVIVPNINTKQDAMEAVHSVYYPPLGRRGVGLARAQNYGADFQSYLEWIQSNAIVIVMIEHIDAVNNLEEIFSVTGVDGFIIGPYDLSASMGFPGEFNKQQVIEAIDKILEVGKTKGVSGGIHIVDPSVDLLQYYIEKGFSFIGYGMDIRFLDIMCREHLSKIESFK